MLFIDTYGRCIFMSAILIFNRKSWSGELLRGLGMRLLFKKGEEL